MLATAALAGSLFVIALFLLRWVRSWTRTATSKIGKAIAWVCFVFVGALVVLFGGMVVLALLMPGRM